MAAEGAGSPLHVSFLWTAHNAAPVAPSPGGLLTCVVPSWATVHDLCHLALQQHPPPAAIAHAWGSRRPRVSVGYDGASLTGSESLGELRARGSGRLWPFVIAVYPPGADRERGHGSGRRRSRAGPRRDFHRVRRRYFKAAVHCTPTDRDTIMNAFWGGTVQFGLLGCTAEEFDGAGLRLLCNMLVQTKLDATAVPFARDLARALTRTGRAPLLERWAHPVTRLSVVDPFAGSGNLWWHCARMQVGMPPYTSAEEEVLQPAEFYVPIDAVAIERNEQVFDHTAHNLAHVARHHAVDLAGGAVFVLGDGLQPPEAVLPRRHHRGHYCLVLLDPPWAHGWRKGRGLDLRRTAPPFPKILRTWCRLLSDFCADDHLLFAFPCPRHVVRHSFNKVVAEFISPLWLRKPLASEDYSPTITLGVAKPWKAAEAFCAGIAAKVGGLTPHQLGRLQRMVGNAKAWKRKAWKRFKLLHGRQKPSTARRPHRHRHS
eukprot:TRINITY_DN35806_c0_g1_i2.p2 TRINITY_DN35806_c0_g1~~TRINITY_DN35806_c0_g1_i2.p2  ORF type:complete len:486 (+),score=86.39 TRINITY_DN35806_c0_g1_i2:79-1536(+)